MTDSIVYVDRSSIKEGKADEVRKRIQGLVEFIETREDQLARYQFFFDDEARHMTVIAVHPDSESLKAHMEIGRSAFAGFSELIDMTGIEVYGHPSAEVMELLEDKARMLGDAGNVEVHSLVGGFVRPS